MILKSQDSSQVSDTTPSALFCTVQDTKDGVVTKTTGDLHKEAKTELDPNLSTVHLNVYSNFILQVLVLQCDARNTTISLILVPLPLQ